ncbi:nicotinate-nucleotide--dimethylbenzimidazole phosphoribosyltransferase [Salinisphaera sp. T31B1]|uniref:nicotinate-nucleotide--dimethylbenzimidazole phosphoribosyltransferase n=1 Tax=Salinisphaera sp. T31B1 TaxID=727963 RepID=UPI00333E581C
MDSWYQAAVAAIDRQATDAARARQASLTKPPGSLGRLEALAESFAGWQGRALPVLGRIDVCVFAADHGVAAQGVSAFPQAVTGQMLSNFAAGGAAVNVLAREHGAHLAVVDVGTLGIQAQPFGVIEQRLAPGTDDFTRGPAMSQALLAAALQIGRDRVDAGSSLFIGGEMGIGNTTAASAVLAALLVVEPAEVVGRGTGIDDPTLARKANVVADGLARHAPGWRGLAEPERCVRILADVGGLEIAALTGSMIAAAQAGVPVLVDGFITTVAALAACRLNPGVRDWLLFAHRSAETGHGRVLAALEAEPILDLGMCLGEGSAAVLAVSIVRSALALHAGMASFEDAGVDDGR